MSIFTHVKTKQNLSMASTKYRPYWFKSNLCTLMGITLNQLEELVSDECKTAVGWKEGIQKFRDYQVITILKDLFREMSMNEIRQMIGYNPQFEVDFAPKRAE